jgi:hypothetical protein
MKKSISFLVAVTVALGIALGVFSVQPAGAACEDEGTTFRIISRDVSGTLLPGIQYAIHAENTNPDGNPYLGASIKTGTTDAGGQATFCTTATGPFAVNFYEYSASYGNYVVWSSQLSASGQTLIAEARMSYLSVIVRDGEGGLIKNVKYDVFVQAYDVDGSPIIDETALQRAKLVSDKYNTGADGEDRSYLGAGKYVVRIHGTGSTYFTLWEQNVANAAATTLDYRLGTLRVVLEDGLGGLIKDRKFDLYTQDYDVREKPIFGTLVASKLDVGSAGKYDAYVPPGTYALKITGSISGVVYSSWGIKVKSETLTKREYKLSGLRIILKENNKLAKNVAFDIGMQDTDAVGAPALKQNIYSGNTGELGYSDIYLAPGKYVLSYGTNRVYNLDVFENRFTVVDWPNVVTIRRQEMTLTNPVVNRLTLKGIADAIVRGISKVKARVSKTYRVDVQRILKPYTVSLAYSASSLRARGYNPAKVRIAYYNPKTKSWSLIGRNNTKLQRVSTSVSGAGTFVLVVTK